jgi:SAM-dependent methyltransferase
MFRCGRCALTAFGRSVQAPAIPAMNSRRRMRHPPKDHAYESIVLALCREAVGAQDRFGSFATDRAAPACHLMSALLRWHRLVAANDRILAQRLYPDIDFREADAERLPFSDDTFDAVVCAFGLGHFSRPELAVAECVRTLSPGGRIAFA